ncbi:MAG: hypothetical protein H6Q86_666 [candidate division NC10 bacterium]|nr:hypothetical protein [candidate division NC10 bacterium]
MEAGPLEIIGPWLRPLPAVHGDKNEAEAMKSCASSWT